MRGTILNVNKLCIALLIGVAQMLATAQARPLDAVEVNFLGAAPDALAVWQSDEGIVIKRVEVSGLSRLDEAVVLAGLTIKAGDILVGNATAKLNDSADALYDTGWFMSTPELALDLADDGGAVLKVQVAENPVYKGTQIKGNTLVSTERLVQEVEGKAAVSGQPASGGKLVKGQVINARKLISALDGMLGAYQNLGYLGIGIDNYDFRGMMGQDPGIVVVVVSEGVIDEIIVSGQERTRESVIRGRITHMRPGSVLRRDDLERDMQEIYNTGLFEEVTPDFEPSLNPGQIKVVVAVKEASTGQAGVGLGYSTVNGLQGTLSYSERNLFGAGKAVGAQLIFSRNQPGFEVSFSDPYAADGSFWSTSVSNLHSRQQRFPGQPYESELGIDTKGASFTYGRHLNDYDTWSSSFSVQDYNYTVRKGDPFRGLSPRQRARLSAEGETRKLGVNYTHDTRDNVFDTHEGFYGSGTGELAGFGGDFDFNKYTFETREFWRAGPGTVAMRQRLGFATGDVPLYEEYRFGGVNSIRGLSEDLLTGTHGVLTNFEYRVPLNDMFGVVGFLDSGWAGESFGEMEGATGAGIGARIKVKALGLGAVRLDYGIGLNGGADGTSSERFHFFLGEMF